MDRLVFLMMTPASSSPRIWKNLRGDLKGSFAMALARSLLAPFQGDKHSFMNTDPAICLGASGLAAKLDFQTFPGPPNPRC